MKIIQTFNNRNLDEEADKIRIKIYDLLREIPYDKLELEEEELLYLYNAIFDDEEYEIENGEENNDENDEEDENNDDNEDDDEYHLDNIEIIENKIKEIIPQIMDEIFRRGKFELDIILNQIEGEI